MGENQYKPVPDMECLKYHGTPDNPDIKIFVSHRIDLESETIDNPLYIPVRCGAVYDNREGITMLGDDTGDNISEKRNSFCELTVQYWAWKNVEADYYGLCHYRRYLSFADNPFEAKDDCLVHEKYITQDAVQRHQLMESVMREEIEKYDVLFSYPIDVSHGVGSPESNYNYYKLWPQHFDGTKAIDLLIDIIREKYPEYSPDVERYFSTASSTFYNCFVMKKNLFHEYNQWLFDILFEFEKRLDTSGYNQQKLRAPAFMSEPLCGIYFMHHQRIREIKVGPPHYLILFEHPEHVPNLSPAFAKNNVPVVIPSSNYYAPYLSVCIKSIICHISQDNNYDFIILSADMSEDNKRILKGMECGYPNVSIRFYNPEPLVYEYTNDLYLVPGVDIISFCRVALPFFLKDYKKVVCIDSDLIFEKDVARLYRIPLGKNYLAAVKDAVWQGFLREPNPRFRDYLKDQYPLKYPDGYVNIGVGIYNLSAWRNRYSLQEILKIASQQKYLILEQDVLNLLAEGYIFFLNENWNVYTCDAIKGALVYAPYDDEKKYWASREEPFVIHWANWIKPWVKGDCDFADKFWYYARKTPFYEIILLRMMWDIHNSNIIQPQCTPAFRSKARKIADKVLPKGTKRRQLAKKILPKGSRRWNFCKRIYYFFFKNG